jgi:hypothetical protein
MKLVLNAIHTGEQHNEEGICKVCDIGGFVFVGKRRR